MSDRYIVKVTQNFKYGMVDCPVQLNKYQIVFDNLVGKQFLRIALTCYTNIGVDEVDLQVECFDKDLQLISRLSNAVVDEHCATMYAEFGKSALIEIPNNTASLSCIIKRVVLHDNSKWIKADESSIGQIDDNVNFTQLPYSTQLEKFAAQNNINLRFIPADYKNYWKCTCAYLNSSNHEVCGACGTNKENLFLLFNEEFLHKCDLYQEAYVAYKSGSYLTAIKIFNSIIEFRNSKERFDESIEQYVNNILFYAKSNPSICTFDESVKKLKDVECYVDIKPYLKQIEQITNEYIIFSYVKTNPSMRKFDEAILKLNETKNCVDDAQTTLKKLEELRITYVEKTYNDAILLARQNKTIEGFSRSIEKLNEIKDYKDVTKVLNVCQKALDSLRKAKRRKVILGIGIVAAVAAVTAVIVTVIICCL